MVFVFVFQNVQSFDERGLGQSATENRQKQKSIPTKELNANAILQPFMRTLIYLPEKLIEKYLPSFFRTKIDIGQTEQKTLSALLTLKKKKSNSAYFIFILYVLTRRFMLLIKFIHCDLTTKINLKTKNQSVFSFKRHQ